MPTVYFAKWILLASGDILENGGISVQDGIITSIGSRSHIHRTSKDRIVNLGNMLLLPGFINIHTHLEEGVVRGFPRNEDESFAKWQNRRNKSLIESTKEHIQSLVRLGIRESLANGITTIVDNSKLNISPEILSEEPIRSWTIHEISETSTDTDKTIIDKINTLIAQNKDFSNFGISPYALYSLHPLLQKKILNIIREKNYLWSSHIAESFEEMQAFSEHAGEIFENHKSHGEWPFGSVGQGSLNFAVTENLIPNHGICCHCNYATGQEFTLLSVKKASVVLCPQYSESMNHKPFLLDVAINRGINVCIGTESPDISRPMDLLDELYLLKTQYPHITAKQAIDMITINPAKALKCSKELGTLDINKKADIIGLRFYHNPQEDLLEELIQEKAQTVFVMVNGEEIIFEK